MGVSEVDSSSDRNVSWTNARSIFSNRFCQRRRRECDGDLGASVGTFARVSAH